MPEYIPAGVVTNSGQPLAAVGKPASETETAPAGVGVPVANVTVTGAPAVE